ncbi:MAG: radical SAM protein [Candidatus Sumerlaeia bacterium]|nr:radical SAM protein [Candidatus Sumerlaeia bacterium]
MSVAQPVPGAPDDLRTASVCHHLTGGEGARVFDPLEVARATERVVCRGNQRKYSRFGFTRDYHYGVATGYVVGCNLRCLFCWAAPTRDNVGGEGRWCEPAEAAEELERIARQRRTGFVRLSEGEPTIGREHLLGVLEEVERRASIRRFVLETNGTLLGAEESYVAALARFPKLWVRLALKAGTPEAWTHKTGASPESFALPFEALRLLRRHGLQSRLSVAAMSRDPRFMGQHERVLLLAELARVDPQMVLDLNEEMVVTHPATMRRLAAAGYPLKRYIRVPGLWRWVQVAYRPAGLLGRKHISLRHSLSAVKNLFFGT